MKISTKKYTALVLCLVISIFTHVPVYSDWSGFFNDARKTLLKPGNNSFSDEEISMALKDALRIGARKSVDTLGKTNGFYKDAEVKIPIPDQLRRVEKLLNQLGQKELVKNFRLTMNRAAEQASQTTFDIFADAIKNMTIQDATKIYSGREDEATRYFRQKKEAQLFETIKPIVQKATASTGTTSNYKKIVYRTKKINRSIARGLPDIDEYVTRKTIDGLFHKIAQQEAKIRKNPVERTTEILKQVFGAKQ